MKPSLHCLPNHCVFIAAAIVAAVLLYAAVALGQAASQPVVTEQGVVFRGRRPR